MKNKSLYRVLFIMRFFNVFTFSPGYIHPDEFFQSAEIVAGDIFKVDVYRPWEFNQTNPIRAITFSYITCGFPFFLLKYFSKLSDFLFQQPLLSTYSLVIAPRIMVTFLSLLLDWFLWRTCRLFGKNHWQPLMMLSTSYITYTYHSRPFSNTVESILFAAVLYYVLKALHHINKVSSVVRPSELSAIHYGNLHCYQISVLVTAGVFNRPTFLLFVLAPLLFWIQYGLRPLSKNYVQVLLRILSLVAGSYVAILVFALCDSLYYEYITLDDLLDMKFVLVNYKKLVWTPFNFIKYNIDSRNLARHGLHPPWLHGLVHLPMLFANLAIYGMLSYWKMLFKILKTGTVEKINPVKAAMLCSFVIPVILLSVFPHQEPRFLTPLLFPLLFLQGKTVWKKQLSVSRVIWLSINVLLFVFYGYFHQGGLIPTMKHATDLIVNDDSPQHHLIFFHTYMPPRHLVTVPLLGKTIKFHDLAGENVLMLEKEISAIDKTRASIFLLAPASLNKLEENLRHVFHLELVHRQWPHFSAEDIPLPNDVLSTNVALKSYLRNFVFNLYKINKLQK